MIASGVGRLTKDPKMMTTQSGKRVVRFTLATSRIGQKDVADYISCVAWEKTAEIVSVYCKKGTQIYVEGDIQTSTYDDPNYSGRKVYNTDVVVSRLTLLGSKPKEEEAEAPTFDDLPF